MKIQCEIGEGNNYFKKRLSNYNRLGRIYETFWELAFTDYIQYQRGTTEQGLRHCKTVENNIWLLIREYFNIFPDEALYILSLSSALHDCAKNQSLNKSEDHALNGSEIIRRGIVGRYVEKQVTADAIAYIVASHASGKFIPINEPFNAGSDTPVMLRECAAIFRLADMMDTTEERAPKYLDKAEQVSFLENVRRNISTCIPDMDDKSKIKIVPSSDKISDLSNLQEYLNGLNNDLTDEHIQLLKSFRIVHYTKKGKRKEIKISLPHEFYIALPTTTIFGKDFQKPSAKPAETLGTNRLTPCYFLNSETNFDIQSEFLSCIEKAEIDPKFLYWSLIGTKKYLELRRNPFYTLPRISNDLLVKCFKSELYTIINNNDEVKAIIDLGLGDGTEVSIMLSIFLESKIAQDDKFKCILIDSSYHMLRVAVNNIVNTVKIPYLKNILLIAINEDFRKLYMLRDKITGEGKTRLFCLLGGTLGNYLEREIIGPISNELFDKDFFFLGVDLIGSRSNEDLEASYDSIYNRDFLFAPLSEIGYKFESASFECSISDRISDVPNSKTIISWFNLDNGKKVRTAISTKYDLGSLKDYLQNKFGFKVLKVVKNETADYVLLLLGK